MVSTKKWSLDTYINLRWIPFFKLLLNRLFTLSIIENSIKEECVKYRYKSYELTINLTCNGWLSCIRWSNLCSHRISWCIMSQRFFKPDIRSSHPIKEFHYVYMFSSILFMEVLHDINQIFMGKCWKNNDTF